LGVIPAGLGFGFVGSGKGVQAESPIKMLKMRVMKRMRRLCKEL